MKKSVCFSENNFYGHFKSKIKENSKLVVHFRHLRYKIRSAEKKIIKIKITNAISFMLELLELKIQINLIKIKSDRCRLIHLC